MIYKSPLKTELVKLQQVTVLIVSVVEPEIKIVILALIPFFSKRNNKKNMLIQAAVVK